MSRHFGIISILLLLLSAWGCGGKSARLQSGAVPPDKTLYENGMEWLKKSQFLKARLAFQTLINTYPDSELAPKAYFAMADSWYKEGGKEAWLQAEAQYKDFIIFYPTHEKAAEAQLKIATLNMRMMTTPDRDTTYARKAEAELKKFIEQFPDDFRVPEAKQKLREVRDVLAEHEYLVGHFYYQKKSYGAAISRFQEVAQKFPDYSRADDVYFLLADALQKTERPDEAATYYAKIVQGYPFSQHHRAAQERLAAMNKPVPPVDPVLAAQNQRNVREEPGFSLLRPVKDFTRIFTLGPDPFEEINRAAEARLSAQAEAAKSAAADAGAEGKSEGFTIETVIRKGPEGEAREKTTINPSGTPSSAGENGSAPEKDNGDKRSKKKKEDKKR